MYATVFSMHKVIAKKDQGIVDLVWFTLSTQRCDGMVGNKQTKTFWNLLTPSILIQF